MAAFTKFEEIGAWQKARELAALIYSLTNREQFGGDYALKNQLRRSALASMTNIADGFNRDCNSEFAHCLGMSKGAAAEIKSLLYVALDQRYLTDELFQQAFDLTNDVERLASGLMKYLRSGNSGR